MPLMLLNGVLHMRYSLGSLTPGFMIGLDASYLVWSQLPGTPDHPGVLLTDALIWMY